MAPEFRVLAWLRPRAGLRRALGLGLVLAVLSTVAAVRTPTDTVAAPTLRGDLHGSARSAPMPTEVRPSLTSSVGPLLGELIGTTYRVRVYAGADGARYSVLTLSGELLFEGLEADEVYRVVPGLDVRELQAIDGTGGAIMRATEPSGW